MLMFSQEHMDRLNKNAAAEDALAEFERALKDMDKVMQRVIAATIKLRDTRAGADAKYKY